MTTTQPHDAEDMPAEIDFSAGERGKFYHQDTQLRLPVHLEADVQNTLAEIAGAKGVGLSALVNDLLRRDIASMRQQGRGQNPTTRAL